jgi:hypothetical protein
VLNEQSACDVVSLLEYWAEEPPAHVTLALRYLGQGKRGSAKPIDEAQARQDMGQMGQILGQQPAPLPDHLKSMVRIAEQMKGVHKGIAA